MDQTALALMVVDPQKGEPFLPLGHWEQALNRAVKLDPGKLLVAARCDRGGDVIGQRVIDDYLRDRGYAGHVNTSAKQVNDTGCAELKHLIAKHIPRDRLPSTSTTKLFKALKDAVIEIKESGIVLIRVVELEQRLRLGSKGEPFEERKLRTVIGLLAGQGLIQPLAFGDFVLLQPEQINNYGSAVVRVARVARARDSELAELSEQDVLEDRIDFQDLKRLKEDDTRARIRAYFNGHIAVDTEVLFIKYIHEHLKRYAMDVTRIRDYVCPHCKTSVENKKSIARKLNEGKADMICVECEERVALLDMIEEKFSSDELLTNVRKMDEQAQIHLDNESLELILVGHAFSTTGEAGHIFRPTPNSDSGIHGEIKFKNDKGLASGFIYSSIPGTAI